MANSSLSPPAPAGLAPSSRPSRLSSSLVLLLLSSVAITTDASVLSLLGLGGDSESDAAEKLQFAPPSPAAPGVHAPGVPAPGGVVDEQPSSVRPLNSFGQETYGVDVSFPIHHYKISDNYAWLPHNVDPENNPTPREYVGMPIQFLGNRQAEYDKLVNGCIKHYDGDKKKKKSRGMSVCEVTERDRVDMSLRQPKSMQNYTELGFKKIRAPPDVWEKIQQFWADNKDRKNWKDENWPRGNTYTNHWESPTYMVSVEDTRLRGAGARLKKSLWNAARETMQEWTGEEVTECSLYGIRVYTEGAVLATHVDRMPLVSSAIINVDQDTDEPWPIEVFAHDGKAYNVTMEPGDMVLYESHTVLHGRPFALKGRFFANIFIHFEPTGHSLRHDAKEAADQLAANDHHKRYTKDVKNGQGGHENQIDGLPPYILRGSIEEERWMKEHAGGTGGNVGKSNTFTTGSTPAHKAAQVGDADKLSEVIDNLGHLLDARDANGWTPLHEGARAGHEEVVKLLLKKGANVNGRTDEEKGGTALYWSIQEHGEDHPVSKLLMEFGGLSIGPDL